MKTLLVANAKSRRGREWFRVAVSRMAELGIEAEETRILKNPGVLPKLIDETYKQGFRRFLVGGGDGTLSLAAEALVGKEEAHLGVLPFGTGNSFARDLGIKTDIEHALQIIAEGNIEHIDVGKINDMNFLNVATLGLSSLVAAGLQPHMKKRFGPFAYLMPALQASRLVKPFHVRIDLPEGASEFEAFQLVIGNGRFHAGPFPLGHGAGLTAGSLVVYAVDTSRRSALLRYALALAAGRHSDLPEVRTWYVQEGRIETRPVKKVVVDGEPSTTTPANFSLLPGALKVYAPVNLDANLPKPEAPA